MRRATPRPTSNRCTVTRELVAGLTLTLICLSIITAPARGSGGADDGTVEIRSALVIEPVGSGGRRPVHRDAIESALVTGTWKPPTDGQTLDLPGGTERTWQTLEANADGWFSHRALRGGYAHASVELKQATVMLLEARGHSMVYVNGQPRAGDPYSNGLLRLPVALQAGSNELLFRCARGRLQARLVPIDSPLALDPGDATLPDLVVGTATDAWAGVRIINASAQAVHGLILRVRWPDGRSEQTPAGPLAPFSVRKQPLHLSGPALTEPGTMSISVELGHGSAANGGWHALDATDLSLRVRGPQETRRVTFVSEIDGSVQHYGLQPARPAPGTKTAPGLVLSLHGASVEALNQAGSYAAKSWCHVVAPTNRRPFGFDWEDWGRRDAMEVLDHAQRTLGSDPQRTYLTGHSMGGHGAWHVGATFPDRFAALGPSAAWISFWTYGGAYSAENAQGIVERLLRPTSPSQTLRLAANYSRHGIYILHGDKDDNVPVGQARQMRKVLGDVGAALSYHEQPGAGHWWDDGPGSGVACVDWPPMFDLFARHRIPAAQEVRRVAFRTASPGISASCHWVSIECQEKPFDVSSVDIVADPPRRLMQGETTNVARLSLQVSAFTPEGPLRIELDGDVLDDVPWPAESQRLWLERRGETWAMSSPPSPALKGPHRYGPFKEAFGNRAVLIYGTAGNDQENAWALAKARYDAETFYYRGNGAFEVVADHDFDPGSQPDRSLVLYGNADTNAAWSALLGDSPVQIRRGALTAGDRTLEGATLACLLVRPRPGSPRALVAAVSGTGLAGLRLTERLPYFVSGVAYPDLTVLDTSVLTHGVSGVRAAGFFGADWSLETGDVVWKD